jgi:ribosomal protein L7/L12
MSIERILDAVSAIDTAIDTNSDLSKVVDAGRRAQVQLLKAAMLVVTSKLPVTSRSNKNPNNLTKAEQLKARETYGKIPAIKMVRERTGVGLKEAKDAVENWMGKNLGYTHVPSKRINVYRDGLALTSLEVLPNGAVYFGGNPISFPHEVETGISDFAKGDLVSTHYDNYDWTWAV